MRDQFSLQGKVVLVTGASRGIGLAIAAGAARLQAEHVILNGVDRAELGTAVGRLRDDGLKVDGAPFDVTDEDAVKACIANIISDHGQLDVLISNAGAGAPTTPLQMTGADFRSMMVVNLDSHFYLARECLSHMQERRAGSLVFTASINSLMSRSGSAAYSAAKAGIGGMVRALSAEFASCGIRVNAFCPGFVETAMTAHLKEKAEVYDYIRRRIPIGRWADPDDMAGPALFLASDAARYVTGQMLVADGGFTTGFSTP